MKKIFLILLVSVLSAQAYAGFFKYEVDLDGPKKMCIYGGAMGDSSIMISDISMCPMST